MPVLLVAACFLPNTVPPPFAVLFGGGVLILSGCAADAAMANSFAEGERRSADRSSQTGPVIQFAEERPRGLDASLGQADVSGSLLLEAHESTLRLTLEAIIMMWPCSHKADLGEPVV